MRRIEEERTPLATRLMEAFVFLIDGFWIVAAVLALLVIGVLALLGR